MSGLLDALEDQSVVTENDAETEVGTGEGEAPQSQIDETEEALVAAEVGINNTEWETDQADGQVEQLQDAGEELEEIQATLEAMDGRFDIPDFMQNHVYRQYQRVCSRLGVEAPIASVEDYGDNPMGNVVFRDSLESSIKEVAKNIWVAIIKAIEKMQELGQRLWNYLTDFSTKLDKKAREVAQAVTGDMSPNSEFKPQAYADLCWLENNKMVFNKSTLGKTGKWLDSVKGKVEDDVHGSEELARNLSKAMISDFNDQGLIANITDLISRSFLQEPIKRVWKYDASGINNKTVLFNPKEPTMPGGYAIYIHATMITGNVELESPWRLLNSIRFFEQSAVKDRNVQSGKAQDVNKQDLVKLLGSVSNACNVVHNQRTAFEHRQRVSKELKVHVQKISDKLRDEDIPAEFKQMIRRIGGLVRALVNALYQRADVYSVRAMKIARAAVKLGEQFSYSEQRARTVDSTATDVPKEALPA